MPSQAYSLCHISTVGTISNVMDHLVDHLEDYPDDENCDTDALGYSELAWPSDSRWRPAVAVLGAVVAVGAIATAVIVNSGDSATTKATVGARTPAPYTVMTTPSLPSTALTPPSPRPTSAPTLPRETITTVTPTGPAALPTLGPVPTLPNAAPPSIATPAPALNPRTVIYSVSGSKQLIDLVNIVYTDARGFPVTEFNVTLPWTKAVVLNPGVETESVVATSLTSRLTCSIVNAQGQLVKASTGSSIIATCTR